MKTIKVKVLSMLLVVAIVFGMMPAMATPAYAAINGRATLTKEGDNFFTGTYNLNGAEPGTEDGWGNIYFFEDYSTPVKLDATGDITVQITLTGAQNYWELRGISHSYTVKSLDADRKVNGNWVITIVFPAPSERTFYMGGVNLYKDDKDTYSGINVNFLFAPNTVANTMTLSSTSGTLTYPNGTTITANNNNGGAITATSSNNNVATVSKIDGNKITITPAAVTKDGETAIITVKSAKKDNVLEGTKTYNVTVNRGTFTLTPAPYSGTYDGNSHKATIKSSIDGVKIVSGASESYGNTVVNSSTANTNYDLAPFFTNVPGGTIYYKGTRDGYKPVTGSTKVTINKAPAFNKEELTDDQKPAAVEGLEYVGTPGNPTAQDLVEAPTAELPEGYDHVEYSIDGGKTWTASLAQGTVNGDYTVKVKYVGDGNHVDFMGDDISVTIDKNADQLAADEVIDEIHELPAELEVETTDREAIEAARDAYEELTDEQKAWVEYDEYSEDAIAALEAAELGLVKADAKAELAEYQEEVENSDVYDDQGRAEFADILEDAEKAINEASNADAVAELVASFKDAIDNVNNKAENDRIAADKVIASINENTLENAHKVTTENAEKINKAKADYDALTDDQKALVDEDAEGATTKRLIDNVNSLEAAKVEDMIDDLLPVADIKAEDKERVDAARAAYEALTDDQKTFVDSGRLRNLETAEVNAVKDMIENLPYAEDVTLEDESAIAAARAAYEDLNAAQKIRVGARLGKLEEAEQGLLAAKVRDQINKLPAPAEIKSSDENAIKAARDAYEALNDFEKDIVGEEALNTLKAAEEALEAAKVGDQINELPSENDVKTKDEEAIVAARTAYEGLNDAQKALVDGHNEGKTIEKLEAAERGVKKAVAKELLDEYRAEKEKEVKEQGDEYDAKGQKELTDAVIAGKDEINNALTDAEILAAVSSAIEAIDSVNTKSENDQEAADAVKGIIDALPEAGEVTTEDAEDIKAARDAYDNLTDDQKKFIDEDTLKALTDAEEALAVAAVNEMIDSLPAVAELTIDDKEDIDAARKAYDALSDDQKKGVNHQTLGKLEDAEEALAAIEKEIADQAAADAVEDKVANLPNPNDVTVDDKEAIEAARKAFDELTDDQVAKLHPDTKDHLEQCEEALAEAEKEEADQAAADAVEDKVANLPNPNDVTVDEKEAIEAARKAFDELTDDQIAKLHPDTKDHLEQCEAALEEALAQKDREDQAAADVVEEEINTLPNPMNISASDEEVIQAARDAYEALTDDQKAKVDPETVKALEEAEKTLAGEKAVEYINVEGEGSNWEKGNITGDKFTFKRNVNDHKTFGQFVGILVDGNEISESDYVAKAGSVIIDLKPEFLEKLATGEHTLTAMFEDGEAATVKFAIKEEKKEEVKPDDKKEEVKPDSKNENKTPSNNSDKKSETNPVKTGDENDVAAWLALMLATAMLTTVTTIRVKRERK